MAVGRSAVALLAERGFEDGEPTLNATPYDAAAAGRRMLAEAGWPDERSIGAALIDPVDPTIVTRIFEGV